MTHHIDVEASTGEASYLKSQPDRDAKFTQLFTERFDSLTGWVTSKIGGDTPTAEAGACMLVTRALAKIGAANRHLKTQRN